MCRYALCDDQWGRIEQLLPGKAVSAADNGLFVEAVLSRSRAGIAWRDLPERFGDFRVIHTGHLRWSRKGIGQFVFNALAQDADSERLPAFAGSITFGVSLQIRKYDVVGDIAVTLPDVVAKSPRARKRLPQQRLRRSGNAIRMRRDARPLIGCMTSDKDSFGGIDTHM